MIIMYEYMLSEEFPTITPQNKSRLKKYGAPTALVGAGAYGTYKAYQAGTKQLKHDLYNKFVKSQYEKMKEKEYSGILGHIKKFSDTHLGTHFGDNLSLYKKAQQKAKELADKEVTHYSFGQRVARGIGHWLGIGKSSLSSAEHDTKSALSFLPNVLKYAKEHK